MKTCSAHFDCLSSTTGNTHVTLQWRGAEIRGKKKKSSLLNIARIWRMLPLPAHAADSCFSFLSVSCSHKTVNFDRRKLPLESWVVSLISVGQSGGLYSYFPIGNGFWKNSVTNCLLYSHKSAKGENCVHWQRHTFCFISHCHSLACSAGHHYQESLVWISTCRNVTVIAHLQIQHRQFNIIIIMKKIKHEIMGKYVYCLLRLTS